MLKKQIFVLFWIVFLFCTPVRAQKTVSFTDSTGRTLVLPENIERIVPSGPATQMMLLSFAPEKLAGLSNRLSAAALKIYPKAATLPVFGQIYGTSSLNLEALAAADPQIVIDIGEPKKNVSADMDKLSARTDIPAVHIDASLSDMPQAFRLLGTLLNKESDGEKLASYAAEIYQKTQTVLKKTASKRPRLLYVSGPNGINVLSKGSYHAQVIDMMGNNVAVLSKLSSRGGGSEVNREQILAWDPDVIIFAPDGAYKTVQTDPVWQAAAAVQNGRYYESPAFPYDWISIPPAVNRYMGLIWLSSLLYPDETEFDLKKETARFYQLFYHQNLSPDEIEKLLKNAVPQN